MKLLILLLGISAVGLISISSTSRAGGGPKPKKVYKDTIYRWKTKPVPQVNSKPVAVKPAKTTPVLPGIAEEDRNIHITSTITKFKVKKSAQKLYVYFGDTFKVFRISLGANPLGHKTRQGDNKTPEGTYKISYKNPNSRGYRSLKISYPNEADKSNARKMGVDPGGDIFIHGLWWKQQDPQSHWKDNWTRGCIALNNEQIEEIFRYTEVNTEISILP